ncbi:MAG: hypothetical protein ACTHPS_11175, partial [Streptosporangiaceae bacterium]
PHQGIALEIDDYQAKASCGLLNQDPLGTGNNESVIIDGHLLRLLDSVGKRLARGTVTSA